MAETVKLTVYRGDTFKKRFRYKGPKPDKTPIDMSEMEVEFGARRRGSATSFILLSSADSLNSNGTGIEWVDRDSGEFDVILADEDTLNYKAGLGTWWMKRLPIAGVELGMKRPFGRGDLLVEDL